MSDFTHFDETGASRMADWGEENVAHGTTRVSKRLPLALIVGAFVASALDVGYYYPQLPQQLASHFDDHGQPDDWMPKHQLVGVVLGVMLMTSVILVPSALLVGRMPREMINVPHKDHWFAPEHEAETRRVLTNWGLWFAAATLWFTVVLFHDVLLANLRQPVQLKWLWPLLGGYLAVVGYLLVALIVRFYRVER